MTMQQELQPGSPSARETVFRVEQPSIDAATAWDLRPALVKLLYQQGPSLCLDMDQVTFIDSTGLGMLVSVLKEAREMKGDLRLINLGREVRRTLEVSGLQAMFNQSDPPPPA